MIFKILHPGPSAFIALLSQVIALFQALGLWSMATTTSQKDRASPTSAGTKASHINSFSSKPSLFSLPPNSSGPTTYRRVMSGENIA